MRDDNYITIQCWMMNRLHLTGNELIIYAVIYGYSQNGESTFRGSLSDIAESLKVDRRTVTRILKRLEDRGLIGRIAASDRHIQPNEYKANLDCLSFNYEGSGKMPLPLEAERPHTGGKMPLPTRGKMSPQINNECNYKEKDDINIIPKENEKKPTLSASPRVDYAAMLKVLDQYVSEDQQNSNSFARLLSSLWGYVEMRKRLKNGSGFTMRALEMNIKKAFALANGDMDKASDLFDQSVEHGWQGVYEIKEFQSQNQQPQRQRYNLTSTNAELDASFERLKKDPRYKGVDITDLI